MLSLKIHWKDIVRDPAPCVELINMSHIPKWVSKDAAPSPIVKEMNASLYALNLQNNQIAA
jgi:hypothetical protein